MKEDRDVEISRGGITRMMEERRSRSWNMSCLLGVSLNVTLVGRLKSTNVLYAKYTKQESLFANIMQSSAEQYLELDYGVPEFQIAVLF